VTATKAGYHQKRVLRRVYVADFENGDPVVHEIGVSGEHRTVVMLTKRVAALGFALRVPARSVYNTPHDALADLLKKLELRLSVQRAEVADTERLHRRVTEELSALTPI
jgi:hypothetical protein